MSEPTKLTEPIKLTAPAASTKKAFVNGPKALSVPKTSRVKTPSQEIIPIKSMVFGDWGTGKTHTMWELILMGYKVLCITTDIGGSGLATVIGEANRAGKKSLLDNQLREVVLYDYDEVKEFLDEPEAYFPEIYKFDPDFLVWDGFSSFQGVDVSEEVGNMTASSIPDSRQTVSEAYQAGIQFEKQQWGQVKNMTIRALGNFCDLHNRQTGKVWHKIVICHESLNKTGEKTPLIQGQAANLMGAAFDIIIRCVKSEGKYKYVIDGPASKTRGVVLEPVMDASFTKVWQETTKQLGIEMGAVNMEFIEVIK